MTSCGCWEPRALFAPTCARARYQYGLFEFTLRGWEYSDDAMAVDPTSSYDSSPSSCWARHLGWLIMLAYFCWEFVEILSHALKLAGSLVLPVSLKLTCSLSTQWIVDIKFLYDLSVDAADWILDSSRLPREKCSISRFDIDMLLLTPPPSPPSILGQQSEKSLFSLVSLRISLDRSQLQSVFIIHWPFFCQGLKLLDQKCNPLIKLVRKNKRLFFSDSVAL